MAPNLSADATGVLLTWLEPADPEARQHHRLRMARWDGEAWSAPRQLAAGDSFFANWADVPAAAEGSAGELVAHWLAKLGEDTYAYGVELTGSTDGGATWQPLGLLHDDASPTEHGFVSYVPLAAGFQAFWLDGRAMAADPPGPMQLRTVLLRGAATKPGPSTLLDDRVCECCPTDAALTAEGPIVVYRDRSPTEVRDISIVRADSDGWGSPATLAEDAWTIHGCPVNGPAVAAIGQRVAVAWFTAAAEEPRVMLAFSADAGRTFGSPVTVDAERPLGRVDVALDPAGRAWVSWLATDGDLGQLKLQPFTPAGEAGPVEVVSETTTQRSAGVPRMVRSGGRLLLVWVEDAEPSRLAMAVRSVG